MENKQTNDAPVIVIEQQNEKKRRGALVWILGLAFVAVLGVGGTFAYLTYSTNQASNRVTTAAEITADVLEPKWYKASQDSDAKDAPDGVKIPAEAYKMIPGSVVAKDPFVTNTSESGADEYMGIELSFEKYSDTASDYVSMTGQEVADLLAVYGLSTDGNTTAAGLTLGVNWVQITDAAYGSTQTAKNAAAGADKAFSCTVSDDGKMYFYNEAIVSPLADSEVDESGEAITSTALWTSKTSYTKGSKTSNIFDYIKFLDAATQAQIDELNSILKSTTNGSAKTPSWRVNVKGAAIQVSYTNDSAGTKTTEPVKEAKDFISETDGIQWKTLLETTTNDGLTKGTGLRAGKAIPSQA